MRKRQLFLLLMLIVIAMVVNSCEPGFPPTNAPTLGVSSSLITTPQVIGVNIEKKPDLARFQFPESIDPSARYLFYLHGKIIEDQGIPAVDPEFGEYQYEAILDTLAGNGFRVISEPRKMDTDPLAYAKKVATQVNDLINIGVPPGNITIVGASKGGGIAILASSLLGNPDIRYVIMAICSSETDEEFRQNGIIISGKVLSIYDSADTLAGSCKDLFERSEGKGLTESKEFVLGVGTGHGILYKPLDVWVLPVVNWAMGK